MLIAVLVLQFVALAVLLALIARKPAAIADPRLTALRDQLTTQTRYTDD